MQCVILAGGLGTRIFPLTEKIPKTLIDVNGKPFAHYQLSWLADHGVKEVIYCIGHLGYKIKEYVGDGSTWGLSVKYVDEGENLLGTAGAVRLALDQNLLHNCFYIIYGDSFLPIDFKKVSYAYKKQTKTALMTVFRNDNKFDKSNVKITNDGESMLYDKSFVDANYIDYGLIVTNPNTIYFNVPSNTKYDLSQLYKDLSSKDGITPMEVFDRFYEIGSFQGIKDFQDWIKNEKTFSNS